MANKINCRCFRCSRKISDREIKRVGVRIDTDENAFTFCSECVKALDAFINGDDVATEGDVIVKVEKDKVDNLVQKTVESAIEKFENREAKKVGPYIKELTASRTPVPMKELEKTEDVFNIQFSSLNKFNNAIKLLQENNIVFKHLQNADGCVEMPWGVLQIKQEDYKRWRQAYLDAENKEASEVKPVAIKLPEKPAIRKVEPVKVEKAEKVEPEDKFPPINRKDVPFQNRPAFNKGGTRCWNLIYLALKSGSSLSEVAEAYGLKGGTLNNMTSAAYNSYVRVNKNEPYRVKDVKIIKALRQFAEDNGVRYEDLVCVREIQGPFDDLYFKPAPDRAVLDSNPVSYN